MEAVHIHGNRPTIATFCTLHPSRGAVRYRPRRRTDAYRTVRDDADSPQCKHKLFAQLADGSGQNLAAKQYFSDVIHTAHGNICQMHLDESSFMLFSMQHRPVMAVSKDTPLSCGIWLVTSPEVVVFRS